MIPTDKIQRRQMVQRMLNTCIDNDDKLTEWEQNFIESLMNQHENGSVLSDMQCEILEKIYDKL